MRRQKERGGVKTETELGKSAGGAAETGTEADGSVAGIDR